MPGMGTGICGLILMMEHRWDLLKMKNAKLIRFRKAGRLFQAPVIIRTVARPWYLPMTDLVKKDLSVIQLFDPPFNLAVPNPGYIRGYLPGVRENGGQYTHAAVWLIMAAAALEDKQRTYDLIQMVNPLNHGSTAAGIKKYKTEPYVIAADVYAVENHEGMGGWTWYTGSAGWMYQLLAESFFGLKRTGNRLTIKPCIPDTGII